MKSESNSYHGVKYYIFYIRCASHCKDCPLENDLTFFLSNVYSLYHLHTKLYLQLNCSESNQFGSGLVDTNKSSWHQKTLMVVHVHNRKVRELLH